MYHFVQLHSFHQIDCGSWAGRCFLFQVMMLLRRSPTSASAFQNAKRLSKLAGSMDVPRTPFASHCRF